MDRINFWEKKLGLYCYSLDKKKEIDSNKLLSTLEEITKNYDHYVKNELMADGSTLGEDKIISIIRKEYFENNAIFK